MNAVLALIVIGAIAVAVWVVNMAGVIGNSGCGVFC